MMFRFDHHIKRKERNTGFHYVTHNAILPIHVIAFLIFRLEFAKEFEISVSKMTSTINIEQSSCEQRSYSCGHRGIKYR